MAAGSHISFCNVCNCELRGAWLCESCWERPRVKQAWAKYLDETKIRVTPDDEYCQKFLDAVEDPLRLAIRRARRDWGVV